MSLRILGVDPGTATGWALLAADGNRSRLEEAGVVRSRGYTRASRLADLDGRFSALIDRLQPDGAAVESSYSGRHARAGLQLAESRGVLLAALGRAGVDVFSYSPAQVKSAIVGHGRAEKQQVVYMVVRLLALEKAPARDAADAIAVALTHFHIHAVRSRVDGHHTSC